MEKIVFTNGCFDLLHRGHLYVLEEASKLGKLIVGLNSDESVNRLKGDKRPLQSQERRKKILEGLDFVEKVLIFYEDTPLKLIMEVRPDIIVKGGDYEVNGVVGRELVEEVIIIPLLEGYSTTAILKKIGD